MTLMDKHIIESRRIARAPNVGGAVAVRGRALAVLTLGLALLPLQASSGDKPAARQGEAWPTSVQAHYRLRYNGIDVGRLDINSNTAANTYSLSGSGKVSVLFGAMTWSGSSTVSGAIEEGAAAPATYAFDWRANKKRGAINIGFKDHIAAEVAVKPPAKVRGDSVALTPAHKVGALDPVSAIMMLTKADDRPPCDRRVDIFDGKQRYDIVFTPKRLMRLPPPSGAGPSETAHVCRVMYEPIAGHRANEDTKAYASNRDVEVVLRRIPGSDMLIPYSVTMSIRFVTATAGKIAFTD